jgi:outer membrane protein assembly factor BamB
VKSGRSKDNGKGRAVKARFSTGVGVLALVTALSACSQKETILQGIRQDPQTAVIGEEPDPSALAPVADVAQPIGLPAARANGEWTHRGGTVSHDIGNVALNGALTPIWSAKIGAAAGRKHRITADPVVSGGRVFTLDSRALVTATGTNGATLWQTDLTPASDRADDASGGGLAIGGGLVFATTGFGELVALDPASGGVAWRQKFDAAPAGAPAFADGRVYVTARDGSAWSLSATDGKILWTLPGSPGSGVTGGTSPAVDGRQVIFPFSTGLMISADKEKGQGLWTSFVSGERQGRAYASVRDITGDPVIAGGTVYAASSAGRIIAVSADSGARLWSAGEGAVSPPLVAGGAVFVVNDEDQLVRLKADTGEVVWRIDLPYYLKDKLAKRKQIHAYYGPILAGGRLVVASSAGAVQSYDPASGSLVGSAELPGGAASGPAVAGGTLYVVSTRGQLVAFR